MHQLGPACAHRHAQAHALALCRGAPAALSQALALPYLGLGRPCRSAHARAPVRHSSRSPARPLPEPSAYVQRPRPPAPNGRASRAPAPYHGLVVQCIAIQCSALPLALGHNTLGVLRYNPSLPKLYLSQLYCNTIAQT